jgi:aspartyl-tRNA(Asn)/glutamyl-tRNA(Gln) amidotransferase subunit B
MEEDAGKSIHDVDVYDTLVDLNRAGTPLLEIVSEPDIRSSQEAYNYLTEVRKLVRYLDICDGNMEEGSLRCDANISVRLTGAEKFGTKVEVKNMNSIRNVQRAIEFEINRQIEAMENGESLTQETRAFDALKGITISMRTKEAANDYRYFPEPDLQPLFVDQNQIDAIQSEMPALPRDLFLKYTKEYALSEYDAYNLTDNKGIALYYEELIQLTKNYKAAANWMMGDVKSYLNEFGVEIEEFPLKPTIIASLIELIDEGKVSTSIASQRIFPEMLNSIESPLQIAERLNLIQDSNEDTLKGFILKVFEENQNEVERYRAGEKQLTGFFMGKLMKVSQGKADPKIANSLLRQMLES